MILIDFLKLLGGPDVVTWIQRNSEMFREKPSFRLFSFASCCSHDPEFNAGRLKKQCFAFVFRDANLFVPLNSHPHRINCSMFQRVYAFIYCLAIENCIWSETCLGCSYFACPFRSSPPPPNHPKLASSLQPQRFWWNAKFTFMGIFRRLRNQWFLVGRKSDEPSDTSPSFNEQTALRIAPFVGAQIESFTRWKNQKLKVFTRRCKCTLMVEMLFFLYMVSKGRNFHVREQKEFN